MNNKNIQIKVSINTENINIDTFKKEAYFLIKKSDASIKNDDGLLMGLADEIAIKIFSLLIK